MFTTPNKYQDQTVLANIIKLAIHFAVYTFEININFFFNNLNKIDYNLIETYLQLLIKNSLVSINYKANLNM